jgi:AbrB family looped-hinge helix DNA binding protein
MGDRGRLVVPAELRERLGLVPGSPLLLIEAADGLVVTTRDGARDVVRRQLRGASLVDELLTERRDEAAREEG